jgi:hypothetical protein
MKMSSAAKDLNGMLTLRANGAGRDIVTATFGYVNDF